MFPWQSNASANIEEDGPETPAHIFPVRAFKHALFGTPAAPKTAPRPVPGRAQSSHDKQSVRDSEYSDLSPIKAGGILRTPGTAGQKRKSVSFGGGPGRTHENAVVAHSEEKGDKGVTLRETTKPSEFASKLRDLKDSSTIMTQSDVTLDMDAPRSVSGNYWRNEFQSYSQNTERQLKKLAKKEQVAKKYAQLRDGVAAQLEDDLQREQARAQELECKVDEFRRRLEGALQGSGHSHASVEKEEELERLRSENERLRAQLRRQWQSETDARISTRPLKPEPRSAAHHLVNRAAMASKRVGSSMGLTQSSERVETIPGAGSLQVHHDRRKDSKAEVSDIWADVGTVKNESSAQRSPARQTPRKRVRERVPLAHRDENAEPGPPTVGDVSGKKASATLSSDKEASSRSSSTAATLGSKLPPTGTTTAAAKSLNAQATDGEHKRSEMTSERQAAARKRIEERKRAKQRATGSS